MKAVKTVRVGSRVSPEVNKWLDKKSSEMGISKSAVIAVAIENYMKEQEVVKGIPEMLEVMKKLNQSTKQSD